MLNFDEKIEVMTAQEDQIVYVTAAEFAKTAQHKALLMTLRSSIDGEGYDIEKVARHVVKAFDELEGAGC